MELPALKVGKPRPTPVVRGGITDLSSAELQELIALIDAHLAELDENGEIE